MDAASPLKRAFGIDEVLLTIYGFLVGNDMNLNAKIMKVRLVSSRFNKFFISSMRSIPLQLKYEALYGGPSREGPIARWLKNYDITTLFKLVVNIKARDIHTICEAFDGLDLSNLEVLDLFISISETSDFRTNVQDLFRCFAQATSLTSLKLYHNNEVESATVYNTFLSYFPVLYSLDIEITLGNIGDNTPTLEYPKRLEHLVYRKLHGNVAFRSESIKTLEVIRRSYLRSISSIDCPSLEKIICQTSLDGPIMMIAGIRADTLVEQFGNTDKDFIADYLKSNTHHILSLDIKSTASISVVPMDYITGRNIPIKVSRDCVIVLFAFHDESEGDDDDEEDY